jgi:hypothetical protein
LKAKLSEECQTAKKVNKKSNLRFEIQIQTKRRRSNANALNNKNGQVAMFSS